MSTPTVVVQCISSRFLVQVPPLAIHNLASDNALHMDRHNWAIREDGTDIGCVKLRLQPQSLHPSPK